MRPVGSAAAVAVALCALIVMAWAATRAESASKPLEMRTLAASVVRMGSLHGKPLYGVRLRAYVCSRSPAEAGRTVPTSFRIAHYVTPRRAAGRRSEPFRVVDNDLYWVVSLGETRGACRHLTFEDVIPPENYGGVESALGALGYSDRYRCYRVQLTLRAALRRTGQSTSTPVSATRRAVVQCGRFHHG
jgi:hypothetical protein